MKFVTVTGALTKARRHVSSASSVQEEEVKLPSKLAEILRLLMARVAAVETLTPPEGIEFEVEVGAAGAVTTLAHNLKSAVRYSVVFWTKVRAGTTYPTAGPILVADELSTDTVLHLRSYTAGRAVIRVEPAFGVIAFNA